MSVLAQVDTSPINDGLRAAAEFLPKFLGFLAILIIGYFIAKIIAAALGKVLERVGFDRAVERGGVKKALDKSQYDASDIVGKLVFYTLFLFVLQMAFGVFGPNPISELISSVIAYLPKVVVAIIIVVVAAAIASAVREIISATLGGLSYGDMLGNVAAIAILAIGVFAALNQLEIAAPIVNGLFYAILAVIAGSAIIAIGGGGIQPMRNRWENVLERYDEEKHHVRREIESTSSEDLKARAEQRKQQAQQADGTTDRPTGTETTGARTGSTAAGGSPTIQLPEDQTTRRY